MLPIDTTPEVTTPETACSERRLATNRANAQLSTGPTSETGKAKSSLNAVKTGLCGRTLVFADAEEAQAYREHVERLFEHWAPIGVAEHTLVQALADTYWRLESIPGLESGTYARGRSRYAELYGEEPDPTVRRVLLDAHIEDVEAKTFRNLRLHERRLQRQLEKDKAELHQLQQKRSAQEELERQAEIKRQYAEARRQQTEADEAHRQEQAQRRRERREAKERAASDPNGFVFTAPTTPNSTGAPSNETNLPADHP
ncbi:MAG: hypothetical protein JOZ45_20690 [Acidobacteriaceae bacterium]|nr:hypothetical protein [Acidobacteriaceae bacterium]